MSYEEYAHAYIYAHVYMNMRFHVIEKTKKDEKSSDVITTRDTLSNESESNHTCYSIISFPSSSFALCNAMPSF